MDLSCYFSSIAEGVSMNLFHKSYLAPWDTRILYDSLLFRSAEMWSAVSPCQSCMLTLNVPLISSLLIIYERLYHAQMCSTFYWYVWTSYASERCGKKPSNLSTLFSSIHLWRSAVLCYWSLTFPEHDPIFFKKKYWCRILRQSIIAKLVQRYSN